MAPWHWAPRLQCAAQVCCSCLPEKVLDGKGVVICCCYDLTIRKVENHGSGLQHPNSSSEKAMLKENGLQYMWFFSWCHANLIRLTTLSSTSLRTRFWWLRRARTTCWWGGKPDLQMWDSPQGSWTNSEKIEKSLRYQLQLHVNISK